MSSNPAAFADAFTFLDKSGCPAAAGFPQTFNGRAPYSVATPTHVDVIRLLHPFTGAAKRYPEIPPFTKKSRAVPDSVQRLPVYSYHRRITIECVCTTCGAKTTPIAESDSVDMGDHYIYGTLDALRVITRK